MKKTSTARLDWLRQRMDEALAAPRVAEPLPPPYAASPRQGADDILEMLALIEGFGPPAPSREKIRYTTILL